jgi:hypothetical protein
LEQVAAKRIEFQEPFESRIKQITSRKHARRAPFGLDARQGFEQGEVGTSHGKLAGVGRTQSGRQPFVALVGENAEQIIAGVICRKLGDVTAGGGLGKVEFDILQSRVESTCGQVQEVKVLALVITIRPRLSLNSVPTEKFALRVTGRMEYRTSCENSLS